MCGHISPPVQTKSTLRTLAEATRTRCPRPTDRLLSSLDLAQLSKPFLYAASSLLGLILLGLLAKPLCPPGVLRSPWDILDVRDVGQSG